MPGSKHSLLAILLLAMPAFAQQTSKQIDAEITRCMEKSGGVTVEMRNCNYAAYTKLDKRLNEVYKVLLAKLPKDQQELLRESQRKWLQFREADRKIEDALNPEAGGTLGLIVMDSYNYSFLLQRVQVLESHLESLE